MTNPTTFGPHDVTDNTLADTLGVGLLPSQDEPPTTTGPTTRWTSGRGFLVLVFLLLVLRLASLIGVLSSGQELEGSILGGDARRYAQMVTAAGTPYADFAVEYPPLVLGSIKLLHRDSAFETLVLLGISQFVLDLGIAAFLWWGFGRRVVLAYLLLSTVFLPFPMQYTRLDLLAVFLATAGWAYLRRGGELRGGAALALSVFAKLWPLALAPLMLIDQRRRGLASWVVTGAIGATAWWLWAGADGMVQVVSFRGATGWQVESLPGNVLQILDHTRTNFAQGAWRIGTMPSWSRPLFTALSIGVTAIGWRWASGSSDTARYGHAGIVSVTAFLVFSAIISPQYTLWLLPFCAISAAAHPRRYGVPSALIFGLSTLGLAVISGQPDGHLYATLPVLARNICLVWLLVLALHDLHADREQRGIFDSPNQNLVTASPSS